MSDNGTTRYCETCGQKIRKLNPHSMDKRKVWLLERIARLNASGIEWIKVQRDGNLIPREDRNKTIQCDDVHAMRLKWFGLCETKAFRSGEYKATPKGIRFLKGKESVPSKIWCREGEVVEVEEHRVHVHEIRGVIYDKTYWDSYAVLQRYEDEPEQGLLF